MLLIRPARFVLMVRAAFHVTVAVLAMRMASLPGAVAFASDAQPGPARFSIDEIETAVDAVLGANLLWFKPNCWKRSLAMRRLMRANGHEVDIVFGMRSDRVAGHAWLENRQGPVGAATIDPRFVPYFRHPPAPEQAREAPTGPED